LGRSHFESNHSKKQDPISKITIAQWGEGVAQMEEHLSNKCETLSLDPKIEKKSGAYSNSGGGPWFQNSEERGKERRIRMSSVLPCVLHLSYL
jgi:hypothetical protein